MRYTPTLGSISPPNRLIGDLSVAEQQIVQITRELIREPRILVFDEPTAALVSREVDRLLQTIDRLRQRGLTILYVSHYLNEIAAICDRSPCCATAWMSLMSTRARRLPKPSSPR